MEETTKNPKVEEEKAEENQAQSKIYPREQSFIAKEEDEFATLLEESFKTGDKFIDGEVVPGVIREISGDYVIVDIGYKSEGQVPKNHFKSEELEVGRRVDVYIDNLENDKGVVELSKEKADRLRIWDEIAHIAENDEVVTGKILARVKGGLSVDIGVKAFLPGSQVDLRPVRTLDRLLGQTMDFKIIKFNKKRGNIVLSRRVLLEKEREELRRGTLEKLSEGAILDGIVKNITEYGAFIDLGGIDGLLHITDMSWGRINHPSDLFQVGDEIKVKVLKYDKEKERVSLGLKQITEDPWKTAREKYPVGTRLRGRVVSITDYGAFVELEEGIEGLVHISEMSWTKRIKHPSKIVKVGDLVEAEVLEIDTEHKRISLGMKQVQPNPWEILAQKYPIGARVRGRVRNITDFGLFVGVDEGIDGLIHISDLSWTQKVRHPSELYKKGDEVEAVVLNIDPENERFSLSIKALTPDPWTRISNEYRGGMKVRGKVMKVADFGVFVELEPGVEGLLHVSEISYERVEKPSDVLKKGDEIDVAIIEVDPVEKKISLSKKLLERTGSPDDYRHYMLDDGSTATKLADVLKEAGVVKDGSEPPAEKKEEKNKGASAMATKESEGEEKKEEEKVVEE
ncbi:MAG: 30S ribosomal protein S1 [Myxococcota bacterium]